MPLTEPLLAALRCPESGQRLRHLSEGSEALEDLNRQISAGAARSRGGTPVSEPLGEALVREDGTLFFPFEDGFPVLLIDRAIETS